MINFLALPSISDIFETLRNFWEFIYESFSSFFSQITGAIEKVGYFFNFGKRLFSSMGDLISYFPPSMVFMVVTVAVVLLIWFIVNVLRDFL